MAAVSAGTVLAWTSPVMPQLTAENSTFPVTADQGKLMYLNSLSILKNGHRANCPQIFACSTTFS